MPTIDKRKYNDIALGRVSSSHSPYMEKAGPYGPTMSVCPNVMSKGVHNIAFSVTPDT